MTKLSFKHRRETPLRVFESTFEAAIYEFAGEFLKSSAFQHALSKGEEREEPVRGFFVKHLPDAFGITKGEAVDIEGHQSPQLDIMIFNKLRNFAFYSGGASILPAEALLVSMEVKSALNSGEAESILLAAQRLHTLRPFRAPLAPRRRGGRSADDQARFFHCVFAYSSDLAEDGWIEKEYSRFAASATRLRISPHVVSRIYVANRGLINLPEGIGHIEQKNEGYRPDAILHACPQLPIPRKRQTRAGSLYRVCGPNGSRMAITKAPGPGPSGSRQDARSRARTRKLSPQGRWYCTGLVSDSFGKLRQFNPSTAESQETKHEQSLGSRPEWRPPTLGLRSVRSEP